MGDIALLVTKIRKFRDERDWKQFHNHKDMALSLVLEASELLEHFQWKRPEEVDQHARENLAEIEDELADVMMLLLELSDNLGVDLKKAVRKKLLKNAEKYPVAKAKGKNTKYNKL